MLRLVRVERTKGPLRPPTPFELETPTMAVKSLTDKCRTNPALISLGRKVLLQEATCLPSRVSFSFCLLATISLASCNPVSETMRISDLDEHIHAIAVDGASLLLATHDGLYQANPNGTLVARSTGMDLKVLRRYPTGSRLLASGHDEDGRGLGLQVSSDGGRTWARFGLGIGQSELHKIAFSNDGTTFYGLLDGLYVSLDGGQSFERRSGLPMGTGDLAVSVTEPLSLYAATVAGLFVSGDGGATWEQQVPDAEITLVTADEAGGAYAFAKGIGLLHAERFGGEFTLVSVGWADPLAELAIDPDDPSNLFAVTSSGAVVLSRDGGLSWAIFGA